jgi:hypothetical protein
VEVDHANRDTMDNRRCNLRFANRAQNCANTGPRRHNRLGIKGVYQIGEHPRFYARIVRQGRRYHLGAFDTAEEAQGAYLKAAQRFYGDFARV